MTERIWKTVMAVIIILEVIAFLFIVTHARPRAIAKFCINEVVAYKQVDVLARQMENFGCTKITITPVDDDYVHVYSVVVYVGE